MLPKSAQTVLTSVFPSLQINQDGWSSVDALLQCSGTDPLIVITLTQSCLPQINQDNWSSVDALRQCIGGQQDDSPHRIMDAQLEAQKGNTSTGEGEVRRGQQAQHAEFFAVVGMVQTGNSDTGKGEVRRCHRHSMWRVLLCLVCSGH